MLDQKFIQLDEEEVQQRKENVFKSFKVCDNEKLCQKRQKDEDVKYDAKESENTLNLLLTATTRFGAK